MKKIFLLILLAYCTVCHAQDKYLETIKVTDNIYVFKPKIDWLHSNCTAIIGRDGILIIDTFIQSTYAEEAIKSLKKISSLPVRYVVNTHWHNDHVMGNDAFKRAYPSCQIIMQDSTYAYMVRNIKPAIESEKESVQQEIESMEKELKDGKKSDGYPITGTSIDFWKWLIKEYKAYQTEYKSNAFVNGDITFDSHMTLNLGTEKVMLMHAEDNGHSEGDVIAWIPDKKILISGDIVVGPTPYATGKNITGIIHSIQKVIDMNPAIIIPGHGVIQRDLAYTKLVHELFTTMQKKSEDALAQKIPVKEAMQNISIPDDLEFKFTQGDAMKKLALNAWFTTWIVYNTYRQKTTSKK